MTKEERRRKLVEESAATILRNNHIIVKDAAQYREMYKSLFETLPPCMGCPDFVIYYCAEEDFCCSDFETHTDIKKEK